ncbi:hypothetical protein KVR01_003054 [Diaporthe batatas]|uniref:uncharacterized protein n=1 Tax=Diaporthe batatas TaxID=748121 RepID=UPI001D04EF5B|nr:uncharacterized protein KVR01_003054 [Diaporthe batatas]KAG8167365.1 hypothetical protein KVR01_003054 [Diaporthe batatas]
MKFTTSVSALAALNAATASPVQPPAQPAAQRIPTSYDPLATLSTVFPSTPSKSSPSSVSRLSGDADALENRPPNLGGMPIGLMDYIADCGTEDQGNPTILAIKIATSFKNVAAGSNMSISVGWAPPYPPAKRIKSKSSSSSSSSSSHSPLAWLFSWWAGTDDDATTGLPPDYDPVPYSAANLPRFSLLGHLEDISPSSEAEAADLQDCFLRSHPDARYWLPGNRIHEAGWVRLVVDDVYWVGGFGDRAYIGWIPVEEWKNVTRAEWEAVKLPGEEKGWKEWSVDEL